MEICYFCNIASRIEQRVHIAFEDELIVAVLATEPVNPGQLLVVAKAHVDTLGELGDKDAAHLFEVTRRLIQAIRKAGIRCEGTEMHLSDGPTSYLPHVVLQLLPRFEGDSLWLQAQRSRDLRYGSESSRLLWWEELSARHGGLWTPKREVSDEELIDIAAKIREAYQWLWGSGPRNPSERPRSRAATDSAR
jgi:histidine triad (HIT) family protein